MIVPQYVEVLVEPRNHPMDGHLTLGSLLNLPGVVEEDIDLTVVDQSLTIRGERESPYDTNRQPPHAAEERYGFFERKFDLPVEADLSTLRATYDAGVLTITVLKIHRSPQSPSH